MSLDIDGLIVKREDGAKRREDRVRGWPITCLDVCIVLQPRRKLVEFEADIRIQDLDNFPLTLFRRRFRAGIRSCRFGL